VTLVINLAVGSHHFINARPAVTFPDSELLAGVVSNNSQCQITCIRAVGRARSRKVSYVGVYLFLGLALGLVLGLSLGLIIPTSCANLVLRVIWQCDIFGTTPVVPTLLLGERSACVPNDSSMVGV